ncbi:MAG: extracellular solute-binding protein [Clostridia bacterium]|nr:extracellular solute-binding protein [Clostridia bacterium]
MKRVIALLLTVVAIISAMIGSACVKGLSEEDKKNSLIIEVHSAGYGTDWIDFMAKEFQKKTGKKVIVTYQVGGQGLTTMAANIESLTSDTDLFFMGGASVTEVYKGQVTVRGQSYSCIYEDLTDLYKTKIEGEDVTVEQKMLESSRTALITDNKYYHFPYVSGMQGFIINKDVWNSAWEIPRTTNELLELCETIKGSGKSPFIYSLEDEYWTTMLPVFVSQYEGVENMNKLWSGYGPDGKRYSNNMIAYTGLLKALEFFHSLLVDSNGYMYRDSKDVSFTNMQSMFLEGAAVMNCNGDWLEKEMFTNYPEVEIEMMKTPVLSAVAEKCSFSGDADKETKLRTLIDYVDGVITEKPSFATDDDVAYIREARSFERAGSGNCAVIPCYANQKQSAKDFLLFMASNEGLKIFRDYTAGCRMPFDYSGIPTRENETTFRKSVIKIMDGAVNGGARKKDKIFTLGEINPYFYNNKFGRFVSVFAASNPKDYKNALQYFTEEVSSVNSLLTNAKIKAGLN